MKCISVFEPWASLLACGHKAYETRRWTPPMDCMKVTVAIHAGKSLAGMRLMDLDPRFGAICDRVLGCDHPYSFGKVVALGTIAFTIPTDGGIAREVISAEKAIGDWSPGRYAWRFVDMQALERPVACRGRQKFFSLPAEVTAQIATQVRF